MKPIFSFGILAAFLMSHALVSAGDWQDEWHSLDNDMRAFRESGQIDRALVVAKKQLELAEKNTDKDAKQNIQVQSLEILAHLYETQKQYAQTEPLYKRMLAIQEKELGPNATYVADILNNMGVAYDELRQFAQAEACFTRALAIHEKNLPPEHLCVNSSLENLSAHYMMLGQYTQAEPLLKRAVANDEKLVMTSPSILAHALVSLAAFYGIQKQYAQAEPLFRRSLSIYEGWLRPDEPHFERAMCLKSLAKLCKETHRDKEAEEFEARFACIRATKR